MSMLTLITTHGALVSGINIWNGSITMRSIEVDCAILTHCPGFIRFEYTLNDGGTVNYRNVGSSIVQYFEDNDCIGFGSSFYTLNSLRLYRSGVSCPSDEVVKIKLCVQVYNFSGTPADFCNPGTGSNISRVELDL